MRQGEETGMNVGFIGLGRMGEPMALNLLRAGQTLHVFNRSQAVVERLVAQGAVRAATPAAMAGAVDVLFTCVLRPEEVEAVYLGEQGIIAGARAGLLCIDTSTVDPMLIRRVSAALDERGVPLLDAPISGGPAGAAAGTLSMMVGGTPEAFAQAKPLLDLLGKKIFHMGASGNGVSAKICNQILTGTTHALVAETMVLGAKLGLDPLRLFEVLRVSSGQSNSLERAVPNFILPGRFDAAYSVTGIIKDLECAIRTAKQYGVRLMLPNVAQQLYVEASGLGHADKDVCAVVLPMEAVAGVAVRSSEVIPNKV
jgi:3-hydroxyisobutyrate dehydrogenase